MEKSAKKEQMGGILGLIERVGNKIPDITVLFIGAFVIVCIVSAILSQISFDYVHPATGKQITVNNMLSGKELVTLMSKMVTNYANFPPLTMVIVATLGIGIADGSGYINTGLKKLLSVTPKFLITPVVILAGMVSHLGPDTGYVIIIPIAAYVLCNGQASAFRRCGIFCRYCRCFFRQLHPVCNRPRNSGLYAERSADYRPDLSG